MVKLAIASHSNFELSDIETKRIGNSYACDTIKAFKKNYPNQTFYWIMGSDSFLELSSWKNYTYVLKEISMIVYMRPGDDFSQIHHLSEQYHKSYHASISIVENTKYEVSSSEIRDRIQTNHYKSDELPKAVDDYIKNNNVY
jgi:nicotinate-nucleotide adenylyltransferase